MQLGSAGPQLQGCKIKCLWNYFGYFLRRMAFQRMANATRNLGYFDLETRELEPLDTPFGPKVYAVSGGRRNTRTEYIRRCPPVKSCSGSRIPVFELSLAYRRQILAFGIVLARHQVNLCLRTAMPHWLDPTLTRVVSSRDLGQVSDPQVLNPSQGL